jgi:hypothetical protein
MDGSMSDRRSTALARVAEGRRIWGYGPVNAVGGRFVSEGNQASRIRPGMPKQVRDDGDGPGDATDQ